MFLCFHERISEKHPAVTSSFSRRERCHGVPPNRVLSSLQDLSFSLEMTPLILTRRCLIRAPTIAIVDFYLLKILSIECDNPSASSLPFFMKQPVTTRPDPPGVWHTGMGHSPRIQLLLRSFGACLSLKPHDEMFCTQAYAPNV